MKHGQKVWLLFWEWSGDHAAVEDRVAAILSPRLSQQTVGRLVEQLYAIHQYDASEQAAYAKRPKEAPYKAEWDLGHCTCGHNPFLNAIYVHDLRVVEDAHSGLEAISYVMPARYRWDLTTDQRQQVREETVETITRTRTGPFSSREIGRYVPPCRATKSP